MEKMIMMMMMMKHSTDGERNPWITQGNTPLVFQVI
jgi:hypothetical protein